MNRAVVNDEEELGPSLEELEAEAAAAAEADAQALRKQVLELQRQIAGGGGAEGGGGAGGATGGRMGGGTDQERLASELVVLLGFRNFRAHI